MDARLAQALSKRALLLATGTPQADGRSTSKCSFAFGTFNSVHDLSGNAMTVPVVASVIAQCLNHWTAAFWEGGLHASFGPSEHWDTRSRLRHRMEALGRRRIMLNI